MSIGRLQGYYWVKYKGEYIIAELTNSSLIEEIWRVTFQNDSLKENDFEEIQNRLYYIRKRKHKTKYSVTSEKAYQNRIHQELRKIYGKAQKCEFCHKENARMYHWALKKGKEYSINKDDYFELCASCHKRYDGFRGDIGDLMRGKPGHNRCPVINSLGETFSSIAEASREKGICQRALLAHLSGETKTAAKLTWKRIREI